MLIKTIVITAKLLIHMLAFTIFHIIFPLKNRYDAYERIIKSTTPCVAVIRVKPDLFRQRSCHRGTERQFHRKPSNKLDATTCQKQVL